MDSNQFESGLVFHRLMVYCMLDFYDLDTHVSVIMAENDDSINKLYLVSFQHNETHFELWLNRSEFINYSRIINVLNQHDYMVNKE